MVTRGQRLAREAFEAELERFEAEGWFTLEGKDPEELGRRAARWVAMVDWGRTEPSPATPAEPRDA